MANNPSIPDESILFVPVRDTYGRRLALVFGNEFERGECPFYTANQCYHCDIGAGEGTQFTPDMNRGRLEIFQKHYDEAIRSIGHLVVYNSGSTLNKAEMSRITLGNILGYAASLKNCGVVSLDSREMYVTGDALDYVVERLRGDQRARAILGIESQSDEIRIGKLNKIMTKETIERAFQVAEGYDGKVGIDINVVFQPPELIGEEAIVEAVETLRYGLDLGSRYAVSVDFNFHPYYPSKRGWIIYKDHPRANLDDAKKALRKMRDEIDARRSDARIFIGWQCEEHDQQPGMRGSELEEGMKMFGQFNVTQDVQVLRQ